MKKSKKMFSKNNNLIISIVALVECILLLSMMSFSWIEAASSLIIEGNNIWITEGHNYDYVYSTSNNQLVDLSSYFYDTEHFSFAEASTANGSDFYLPYYHNGVEKYRKGDTTDYNVTYYNFDFNAKGGAADFYFKPYEDIFYIKDKDKKFTNKDGQKVEVTDEQIEWFLGAFRLAVTVLDENNKYKTVFYSNSGIRTYGIADYNYSSGDVKKVQVTNNKFSDHYFVENSSQRKDPVFSSTAGGTNVNFKIWFETRDKDFIDNVIKPTPEVKEALLGATVNINLKLISSDVSYTTLTFNDYSRSTVSDDSRDMVYFVNGDDYYPMVRTQSLNDKYVWVTSDQSGTPSDTIPTNQELDSPYFVFGHKLGTSFVEKCRWDLDVSELSTYTYNAISATRDSKTENEDGTVSYGLTGYGVWETVTKVNFIDKTTYVSGNKYNAGASQFIEENRIYALNSNIPVKLNYDVNEDYYFAYLPASWRNTAINFVYTNDYYYDSGDIAITWNAPATTTSNEYTALGYTNECELSALQKDGDGIGTWSSVERVNVSAELVDYEIINSSVDVVNYFKVKYGTNDDECVYMTSDINNPFSYYAFVPVESSLIFDYGTLTTSSFTWDAGLINNDCSTFYLTDMSTDSGLWNLAVVVDGTADNLVYDTLNEADTTGASLTYTTVSSTDVRMMPLNNDNHRWITGDLSEQTLIKFTWVAYSAEGYENTQFEYQVNSSIDGIYYLTITESGNIVPSNG